MNSLVAGHVSVAARRYGYRQIFGSLAVKILAEIGAVLAIELLYLAFLLAPEITNPDTAGNQPKDSRTAEKL